LGGRPGAGSGACVEGAVDRRVPVVMGRGRALYQGITYGWAVICYNGLPLGHMLECPKCSPVSVGVFGVLAVSGRGETGGGGWAGGTRGLVRRVPTGN